MSNAQYEMGFRHGAKDGADACEEYEQDFAYKTMSYENGYQAGFAASRAARLAAMKYANHFDHFLDKIHWTERNSTVIDGEEESA